MMDPDRWKVIDLSVKVVGLDERPAGQKGLGGFGIKSQLLKNAYSVPVKYLDRSCTRRERQQRSAA